MVTAIICIAAVVIAIVIVLTIIVYNQMLLLNEVNKRLLVLAKDSIDNERNTEDELQDAIRQLEEQANNRNEQPTAQSYDTDIDLGL